jgi:hypothetical protein
MKKFCPNLLRKGLLIATFAASAALCHAQQGLEARVFDYDPGYYNINSIISSTPKDRATYTDVLNFQPTLFGDKLPGFPINSTLGVAFVGWMRFDAGRYYIASHGRTASAMYYDLAGNGGWETMHLGWDNGRGGNVLTLSNPVVMPIVFYMTISDANLGVFEVRWRKLETNEVVTDASTLWDSLNAFDCRALDDQGRFICSTVAPPADGLPWASTTRISDITADSAAVHGAVMATGTQPIDVTLYWDTENGEIDSDPFTGWKNSVPINIQNVGSFTNVLANLQADTTYYVRVCVTDDSGLEDWGVETLSFTTLGAPVIRNITYTVEYQSAEITLDVARPGINSTFTLYWGEEDGDQSAMGWENEVPLSAAVVGNNVLPLPGLDPHHTYFFKLELATPYGNAERTGSFLTRGLPIIASSSVITGRNNAELTLNVSDPGWEPTFTLYWGEAPSALTSVVPLSAPATGGNMVPISGLQVGETYYYKFEVASPCGTTTESGSFATTHDYIWKGNREVDDSLRSWYTSEYWVDGVVPPDNVSVVFGRDRDDNWGWRPHISLGGQVQRVASLLTQHKHGYVFSEGAFDAPILKTSAGSDIFNADLIVSSNLTVVAPQRQPNGSDLQPLDYMGINLNGSLIGDTPGSILTKLGSYSIIFRGTNSYAGEIRHNAGWLHFNYLHYGTRQGNTRFPYLKSMDIAPILTHLGDISTEYATTRVSLDDSGATLNENLAVNLRGGNLSVFIPNSTAPVNETIGEINLDLAQSSLRLQQYSTEPGVSTFRVKNFKHAPNSFAFFMCQHSKLGNTFRFMVDNASTTLLADLVGGGGAANTKNISILPYFVGGNHYDLENADDARGGFLTYAGANGLRMLHPQNECYNGPLSDVENAVGTDANVLLPDGGATLTQDIAVNALAMNGNLLAETPATLTLASGLLYGGVDTSANITLTTGNANPLRWVSHFTHYHWNNFFSGKLVGSQDFIKAGPAFFHFANTADLSGFTGDIYVLRSRLYVAGQNKFNPGTRLHVARLGQANINHERLGDISGNGEIVPQNGVIFGTAYAQEFNGNDVIFDGAAVSPGDMRPGIMRITTEGRNVNIANATLNIRIDGFDIDNGRQPTYNIYGDEMHDEMHDAIYINGTGPVAIGSDVNIHVTVNPDFKPPRGVATSWVILTSNGSIIPASSYRRHGNAGIKSVTADDPHVNAKWTVDSGLSSDGREALILSCQIHASSLIMVR